MNPLLQVSPYEADEGGLIGRDPRDVTAEEYATLLPGAEVGMRAIRAKCFDCANSWVEVRKCVCTSCPLWPLRMGTRPKGLQAARGYPAKENRE